jgi:hypothetical protein
MHHWLESILGYNPELPMIFTRSAFWWFFAAALAGYTLVYERQSWRNAYLFLVSLFFYYKTAGLFFLLLLFSTAADYGLGHLIYRSQGRWRAAYLWTSVALNLGILAYFKYAYFFTESYNALFHTTLKPLNFLAYWANGIAGTHFNKQQANNNKNPKKKNKKKKKNNTKSKTIKKNKKKKKKKAIGNVKLNKKKVRDM